jgi:hypothetical protein
VHPHTPAEDSALARRQYSIHAYTTVGDTDPDDYDPFAVLGYDPLLSATIEADVEEPVQRATFRFHLGKDEKSISPYMTGGALVGGRPLFDPGRRIKLYEKVVGRTSIPLPPAPPRFHGLGLPTSSATEDERVPQWPNNHQAGDIGILLVHNANQDILFNDAAGFEEIDFSPSARGTVGGGGPAVTEVASAVLNDGANITGGTITIPAGVLTGDDLYCVVTAAGLTSSDPVPTVTDNDVAGNTWTLIGNSSQHRAALYWKKATSATAGTTVTVAGALTNCSAGLTAYRGGIAGNPTTNFSVETNGAGNTQHAAFTPAFADSMICLAICNATAPDPTTNMACTSPGTLEPKRFEYLNTSGNQSGVAHASRVQEGAIASTGVFTWAHADRQVDSFVWAIKPSAPPGAPGTKIGIYWCRATGSNMPPPRIEQQGNHTLAQIITFRDCIETGDPVDSGGPTSDPENDDVFWLPFTTLTARCLVVQVVTGATSTTTPQLSAAANPNLTDVQERADTWTRAGTGGGFGVVTGVKTTAGSTGTTTALLAIESVQAKISFALKPRGVLTDPPQNFDDMPWRPIFVGIIDSADPASDRDDVLEVQARDLFADVLDTWIEPQPDGSGWPIGDNTIEVVLEELLQLADESAGIAPDSGLYARTKFTVIGSPGSILFIPPDIQEAGSTLLAMREKGLQAGWDLRGRFGTPPFDTDDFVLTYYEPDRDRVGARSFIGPDAYFELRAFAKSREGVRNVIKVTPALPPRTPFKIENPTSIGKYGRLYFDVSEDITSLILHPDQAQHLAIAISNDLGEPKAALEIETRLLPFVEVNDLFELAPNLVHHDVPLLLSVSGYTHTFHEDGNGTTVLRLRDAPLAAHSEWRRGEAKMQYIAPSQPAGGAKDGARWSQVAGEDLPPPPPPELEDTMHWASAAPNEAAPTTSFTITIPAGVVAGDIMILGVTSRGHSSSDAYPTVTDNDGGGWTRKISSNPRRGNLYWKRAGSASASKTVTVTGCINSASGGLSAYRGALASGDPIKNATVEANTGGDHTHATFTPAEADSEICLSIHQYQGAQQLGAPSCANPGTLTVRLQFLSLGGSDSAFLHASGRQAGAAATGAFAWDDLGGKGSDTIRFSLPPAV